MKHSPAPPHRRTPATPLRAPQGPGGAERRPPSGDRPSSRVRPLGEQRAPDERVRAAQPCDPLVVWTLTRANVSAGEARMASTCRPRPVRSWQISESSRITERESNRGRGSSARRRASGGRYGRPAPHARGRARAPDHSSSRSRGTGPAHASAPNSARARGRGRTPPVGIVMPLRLDETPRALRSAARGRGSAASDRWMREPAAARTACRGSCRSASRTSPPQIAANRSARPAGRTRPAIARTRSAGSSAYRRSLRDPELLVAPDPGQLERFGQRRVALS